MALRLNIPSISEKADPNVETRSVYVEEWVETLPYANAAATLRILFESLTKLNRSPVKATNRLTLLELYSGPYQFLMEHREKLGVARTASAFEKYRAESEAARRLAAEMAYGYKIVLAHTVGRKTLFGKNKDLALALQRSILFLSFSLLYSYDEYLPSPPVVWRELAELYRYACTAELQDTPAVGADKLSPEWQRSVAHAYKQLLLSSLVDPYHLPQGDIWRVYSLIGRWSDEAELGPMRSAGKGAGIFVIDTQTGQQPVAFAKIEGAGEASQQLLDANPVIAQLQSLLKEGSDDSNRLLLGRVVRALGIPPARHTPRSRIQGLVNLAAGLGSLHHFLSGDPAAYMSLSSSVREAPSAEEGIEIGDVADGAPEPSGRSYRSEDWDLVDRGPGGLGVIKSSRPEIAIGVGELVGVRFNGVGRPTPSWSVGVIRWLNISGSGEYHAGVQLLSEQAQPIFIREESDRSPVDIGQSALALPRLASTKGASLVTPKGYYRKGSQLIVQASGSMMKVRAGSLIESSGAYERFSFEVLA